METGRARGLVTPQQPVLCKPNKQAFQLVLDQLGASPASTIFIDDSVRNVAAAHEMGIFTVLVSPALAAQQSPHQHVAGADLVVSNFNQLRDVLPQVRENRSRRGGRRRGRSGALRCGARHPHRRLTCTDLARMGKDFAQQGPITWPLACIQQHVADSLCPSCCSCYAAGVCCCRASLVGGRACSCASHCQCHGLIRQQHTVAQLRDWRNYHCRAAAAAAVARKPQGMVVVSCSCVVKGVDLVREGQCCPHSLVA